MGQKKVQTSLLAFTGSLGRNPPYHIEEAYTESVQVSTLHGMWYPRRITVNFLTCPSQKKQFPRLFRFERE
mgnify:FL=1